MFADEGFGVHFTNWIKANYTFTHEKDELDFVDGGTLAMQLCPIMAEYDEMVVIDCIDADDGKVGDIFFFPYDAIPKNVSYAGSAHEVEMLQTLQYMELSGDLPKTQILAVIPKRIEPMSFELSKEIKKAAAYMEKTLLEFLAKKGFSYEKTGDFDLQELALNAYKSF